MARTHTSALITTKRGMDVRNACFLPSGTDLHSGGYYSALIGPATGSGTQANNSIQFSPIYVNTSVFVDRINVSLTTSGNAGATVRLAIYADDGTLTPGALIADLGSVPADSGNGTVKEILCAQYLPAGLYWLAALIQNAATLAPVLFSITGLLLPDLGRGSAQSGQPTGYVLTGVSGSLPSPAVGATLNTGVTTRVCVHLA